MTTSRIQALKELQLPSCKHLQYLDLSHNELKMLAGSFLHDDLQVRILDLSSNHISLIEHSTLQMLEKVLRHGFIDLSNNRLLCTCHTGTLNTISSIQERKLLTVNTKDMTCLDTKANDLVFVDDVKIDKLREECFPVYYWHVAMGFVICSGLGTLVVVVRCFRKRRFYLETLWYKLRYKLRKLSSQLRYGQVPKHRFNYDAYISHSPADNHWIEHALLPTLEQTYGFKLCVPDRDFGGRTQTDEIVDAMTQSRCIVFVLSQNFLTGRNYQRFELDLALDQRSEYSKRLLLVGLGHLNPDLLKPLKKFSPLIRAGQVTEWPLSHTECAEHGHASSRLVKKRQVFWDKLASQLYKSMMTDHTSAAPVMTR